MKILFAILFLIFIFIFTVCYIFNIGTNRDLIALGFWCVLSLMNRLDLEKK